jgi:hypothetical protein
MGMSEPLSLPHELKLVRPKGRAFATLYVDGVPFPWYTKDGFHIALSRSEVTGVTVTLVAETVVVDDQYLAPKEKSDE